MLTKTENGIKFYEHNEITDLKNRVASLDKDEQIKAHEEYVSKDEDYLYIEDFKDASKSEYLYRINNKQHPFKQDGSWIALHHYNDEAIEIYSDNKVGNDYMSPNLIIFDKSFNNYVRIAGGINGRHDKLASAYNKVVEGNSPDNIISVIESINAPLLNLTSMKEIADIALSGDIITNDVVVFNTDTIYMIFDYVNCYKGIDSFKTFYNEYQNFKKIGITAENKKDFIELSKRKFMCIQFNVDKGRYSEYSFELIDKAIDALAKVCPELQEILV